MKRIILTPDSRDAIPFPIHDDFITGVKVILDGIGGFMVMGDHEFQIGFVHGIILEDILMS